MGTAEEIDIGTEHGSGANRDQACVNDDTVEIDEDALSQLHVEPIVDTDWRFNPRLVLE